jgi:hypothetical protein
MKQLLSKNGQPIWMISYIMILQVTEPNFRRRTVPELCRFGGSTEPCGTMKYDTPSQWQIIAMF